MAEVGGGGVPGRQLGVLLLLVAILSMHGVQYMSAGAHGPAAVTADRMLDAAGLTAASLAPVALADDVEMAMAPERTAAASAVVTGTMPGQSIPAHVLSLCLGVILAGLALLGAVLALRTTAVPARKPRSRDRGIVLRPRPVPPPDLSVLCLLRI